MNELRDLPSVDRLLNHPDLKLLSTRYGRPQVLEAARDTLAAARTKLVEKPGDFSMEALVLQIGSLLERLSALTLKKVINATGVILQTNLGRAPLSQEALQAMLEVTSGYSTLEYDLEKGARGSRSVHAHDLLCQLIGAEDALVVNNNAGAVLLCLSALANRRKVVISRSQLVEIGGGFRIPDVMRQSGAKLVEVGTTNRVHLSDYEEALKEGAAVVMRAHTSNFKLVGFTSQPELEEIVSIAHQYNAPFLDDLGSGAILDTSAFGLMREPMPQDSIKAGADLVCFSGDKLLGGPQAGIIIGKKDLVARVKRHPLARAVRADKMCLAALSATLRHYLKDEAITRIPVWQMIAAQPETLRSRAETWRQEIGQGDVVAGDSTIGGGSLPGETLPTFTLALTLKSPEKMLKRLRQATPPVIGRIQGDKILLDPRTVLDGEDPVLIDVLKFVFAGAGNEK